MIINKVIQHSMVSGGEDTLTTLPLTNFCSLSEVPFENLKRSLFIELYEAIYDGESRSYRSFYNSRANSPLLGYEFNYNRADILNLLSITSKLVGNIEQILFKVS